MAGRPVDMLTAVSWYIGIFTMQSCQKQQYSSHTVSCTSTMYIAMYVDNVNSNPIVGCSDIDKNDTATGTTCEGNISKEGRPITNLNMVHMSEGSMANNNMILSSANAHLVTHMLTEGNNTGTTTMI